METVRHVKSGEVEGRFKVAGLMIDWRSYCGTIDYVVFKLAFTCAVIGGKGRNVTLPKAGTMPLYPSHPRDVRG